MGFPGNTAGLLLRGVLATGVMASGSANVAHAQAPAQEGKAHSHEGGSHARRKGHGAHEHGLGRMDVAVEGTKAVIEFAVPAESIYGFEHEPKSAGDLKKRDTAVSTLKSGAATLLVFDGKLGCTVTAEHVDPFVLDGKQEKKSGTHGELHARFQATCRKPLGGTRLRFGFAGAFPGIRKLKVQVVGDNSQWGGTVDPSKDVPL